MAVLVKPKTTAEVRARTSARKAILAHQSGRGVSLAILLIGVALFLLPLYVTLAMALKDQSEGATTSMWAWPTHPTLANFREVLTNPNVSFALFLKNTTLIAIVSTTGIVMTSAMAAYGFARVEFAGRDRLFLVLLATMMLPSIITMIPTYVMYARIGWVNTIKPLVVPAFFGGGAFNIFLLRQFYLGIPRELDEAAFLDGANHWTVFWKVLLPLTRPALVTVGVLSFMGAWRDFMGPLLYLNEPDKQTLEVGLRTYAALRAEKWHLLMAGSLLVMIPIIIIFFIGQRSFVKGIVMTGGK